MTDVPARRFLALHLPDFATDRLRRTEPALRRDQPLAIWEFHKSRRLLVAVDTAAAKAGLQAGQALADAQASIPYLLLRPVASAADAAALHALALWARRYTPLTATDPPDGLLFDITGCAHLLGGEAALLGDALSRLKRAGFTARGAVAGVAATAAALARARHDNPIAVSGIELQLAAPLPLGPALRLPSVEQAALARLGLRQIGDLLRQPRAPLARRFGPALMARLDAVTGQRASTIQPVLPPPQLGVSRDMLEPIITRTSIEAVLELLLAELCERLRQAGQGARRLTLSAWPMNGMVQSVTIGTGLPVRAPAHLQRLFAERLEGLEPGLGFERMALDALVTEPMADSQSSFRIVAERAQDVDELAKLLDRLGQRARVRRLAPAASHWPDHAVRAAGPHEPVPMPPQGWATLPGPVLLRRRPLPLTILASPPGEPPQLLCWQGVTHRIRHAEGPLRLEPAWWAGAADPLRRDYYRMETASGLRLWIYRAADRWLLHGHLP